MDKFFVPYVDDSPAAVEIKGHRVLIVSADSDDMVRDLDMLGGDEIREIELCDDSGDDCEVLADLAASINGGVVLAPPGVPPSVMIENLEEELPWIH